MTEIKKKINIEEIANAITHGIGFALSIAGLVILVILAYLNRGILHIVSFSIYGTSSILLYLASTLYHSFPKGKVKSLFKLFDHSAIYLLIAGTYTPIALITLNGTLGWTVFSTIWAIAVLGIIFKVIFIRRFKKLSTFMYLGMGWLVVFVIKPIILNLNITSTVFLVTGGLLYSVGAIFYLWKNLKFNHAIWHFFVLGGSVCHFFTMFYLI